MTAESTVFLAKDRRQDAKPSNEEPRMLLLVNKCDDHQLYQKKPLAYTDSEKKKSALTYQEDGSESLQSEEIETKLNSLSGLCHQFEHRIKTTVMTSELALIWQDFEGVIAEPTLTPEENKHLRTEVIDEVLRICEQLYLNYLHLLDTLQRRAVFSEQANRSRLAAQMALDCTNLLNIHSIRRSVATDMKGKRRARLSAVAQGDGQQGARETPTPLYTKTVIKKSLMHKQIQKKAMERDLMEGCHSMPDLQRETLLEELEMKAVLARPKSPLVLLATKSCSSSENHIEPADDLKRLLQDKVSLEKPMLTDSETDLPPLIKALSHTDSSKPHHVTHILQRLTEEEQCCVRRSRESTGRPEHPQGSVVSVPLSSQTIARTATARFPDRVFHETINIQMYPPVYNDLTGEIELASVRWLDRNLFAGAEITELHKELSRSISNQYLLFDEDPMIEPAMANTKSSLKRKNYEKLFNPVLKGQIRLDMSHKKRTDIPEDHKRPMDMTSHAYATWLKWWKSNLSPDDYLTYVSNQDSDYLSVIFHLYDSVDSDDEEDERNRLLQLQSEEIERQQEKVDALKRLKQTYVPGLWNVNSVMLGGLWKEPALEEKDSADEEFPSSFRQRLQTGQLRLTPEPRDAAAGRMDGDQLQKRLERIWSMLYLPESQRLDMAIKYSSQTYKDQLEEASAAWEHAAQLIQQRELMLSRLELFEREASDPNRFFQRGYNGTSIARMDESRRREKLNSQIAALNEVLTKRIHYIKETFNDTVTYKGRPYGEKMRWDRIEMLYWLQQERHVQALGNLVDGWKNLPVKLPPLDLRQRLHLMVNMTWSGKSPH
ncbi:coiled-coil domain-containing protein 87 [Chanos chanos]|uniref:Coiled-coil domain-containing protein 87 n=1 Tax=Chanos chanos TaxID=29144 RepID=A0A6J2VB44_CHACN|nr:coiled-coil domain-containing protein 87 [Chanos chanos]